MSEKNKTVGKIVKANFSYHYPGGYGLLLEFQLGGSDGLFTQSFLPLTKCSAFISKIGATSEKELLGKLCWLEKIDGLHHADPQPIWEERRMTVGLSTFLKKSGKEEIIYRAIDATDL